MCEPVEGLGSGEDSWDSGVIAVGPSEDAARVLVADALAEYLASVGDLVRWTPVPGDVLLIVPHVRLSQQEALVYREQLKAFLPTGVQVGILPGPVDVMVVADGSTPEGGQ